MRPSADRCVIAFPAERLTRNSFSVFFDIIRGKAGIVPKKHSFDDILYRKTKKIEMVGEEMQPNNPLIQTALSATYGISGGAPQTKLVCVGRCVTLGGRAEPNHTTVPTVGDLGLFRPQPQQTSRSPNPTPLGPDWKAPAKGKYDDAGTDRLPLAVQGICVL